MKDNIPPEEKLLRLIRNDKKQPSLPGIKTVVTGKEPILPYTQPLSVPPVLKPAFALRITLAHLRLIIGSVFLLSVVLLFAVLLYPKLGLKTIVLSEVSTKNVAEDLPDKNKSQKPLDEYTQAIREKKIFSNLSLQGPSTSITTLPIDVIKDINLVGIISGENPQAIIEDKKAQKTYYVTKGQSIGEIILDEIQEGKITLNYKGQRFELHL